MKKDFYLIRLRFQKAKEQKIYKRRRKNKSYRSPQNVNAHPQFSHRKKIDEILLKKYENPLFEFLLENEFFEMPGEEIRICENFSLLTNTDETLSILAEIQAAIHIYLGEAIKLDFSKCKKTDLHTLIVLRIIFNEYRLSQNKLQSKILSKGVVTQIQIQQSQKEEVNKVLFAATIVDKFTTSEIESMMPISTIGIHIGDKSQKHYQENKKGSTATKITKYVAEICEKYNYCLETAAQNNMEALISEVLNNAEDHGLENKWFATATLFEENRLKKVDGKELIGQLCITIMNFGQSFFDGFEQTKVENQQQYKELELMYGEVIGKKGGDKFTKENYFTLYALQDGVSRLKFERESRGTGTMKFINSFLWLGDYEDPNGRYTPSLCILSGKTLLTCTPRYRTFLAGNNDFYLTLNDVKDFSEPPSPSCMKSLETKFPGTILAVTLYLNEKHLTEKFNTNGK